MYENNDVRTTAVLSIRVLISRIPTGYNSIKVFGYNMWHVTNHCNPIESGF